ncbi:MAG: hypothetical protein MUE72_13095 [Chitinophagaceae bacterium]|jgi:hypothetical protein|nr:hypothetical protein [Chitinophagaceae bacterium]
MTELSIIPECYVDTKVAEILGESSKKYNHQHGCGDVANELKKTDRIALGIIDEDKFKGPNAKYFSEFELIKIENNLILKKHKTKKQFLVLICPEVEKWLIADAEKVALNPSTEEFGLPNQLKDFKKISKIKDIDKNIGFYRFIKALVREKSPSITTLKYWIALFKQNELDSIKS